jgi:glycosyltransferase involved in cell wall biosynthesis
VHQSFPAQFGHLAARLVRDRGWRATFVSQTPPGTVAGVDKVMYKTTGGATAQSHYCSRTFENGVWHAAAVYDALKPLRRDVRPDLIVGHSGFGSTIFLGELYPDVPIINYFEYFYRARGADLDFRDDIPVDERDRLRSRTRNAMILLDLEYCAAGYTPTEWQASLLPEAYAPKVRVLHDGIDTAFWRRQHPAVEVMSALKLEPGRPVVTYVSRGLETMRGFDVFMQMAKRVCEANPDPVFVVVGEDRVAYGGDDRRTGGRSFRDHVLAQDAYDLDRFRFPGRLSPQVLVHLLSASTLHVYLTVPFVLSWSLLDAMSCGCVVLGSDTAPVQEVIEDGRNGLLRGFHDVDALAATALDVLADPAGHRPLGNAARATIEAHYALDDVLPRHADMYEEVAARQ